MDFSMIRYPSGWRSYQIYGQHKLYRCTQSQKHIPDEYRPAKLHIRVCNVRWCERRLYLNGCWENRSRGWGWWVNGRFAQCYVLEDLTLAEKWARYFRWLFSSLLSRRRQEMVLDDILYKESYIWNFLSIWFAHIHLWNSLYRVKSCKT